MSPRSDRRETRHPVLALPAIDALQAMPPRPGTPWPAFWPTWRGTPPPAPITPGAGTKRR